MSDIVDEVMNTVQESEGEGITVTETVVEESAPEIEAGVEEAAVEESVPEAVVTEESSPEEEEEESPPEATEESANEETEESVPEESNPEVAEEPVEQVVSDVREILSSSSNPQGVPVINESGDTGPVEQVVSDVRDILTEEPSPVTDSSELTDDLKQRISELDYLRECCGNWVGSGRAGKSNFLTAWENKNGTVDSNVNYEDTLNQLEKLPEIVKLWAERKVTTNSNHLKNIESYTLGKPLFNEKSLLEKVEVVEQLVGLLTDCANGKIGGNQIIEVIDNLY